MRVDKGDNIFVAVMQPGRTIVENQEGTLEGSVTWKADVGDLTPETVDSSNLFPTIATTNGDPGSNHPDDDRLECYNRTITFGNNNIATCVASYFGLTLSQTVPTMSFTGGVTTEPIETHPNFSTFGTAANGAQFDDDGRFLRFSEFVSGSTNSGTNTNFYGVTSYLTPATNIAISWWSNAKPTPSKLATVTSFLPYEANVRKPQGVADFLLLSESIKQVGNFYEITQQYMGSVSPGWNTKIYDGK
jgi:hypothetical protein